MTAVDLFTNVIGRTTFSETVRLHVRVAEACFRVS